MVKMSSQWIVAIIIFVVGAVIIISKPWKNPEDDY